MREKCGQSLGRRGLVRWHSPLRGLLVNWQHIAIRFIAAKVLRKAQERGLTVAVASYDPKIDISCL